MGRGERCYFASLGGYLENVLQWAREHGCEWDTGVRRVFFGV